MFGFFRRKKKDRNIAEEKEEEVEIPEELKNILSPSELSALKRALKEKDQKFVVRKHLKWTKEGKPGWVFLPDDDSPMYFSHPPTPGDIEVAFGDEFGGGNYHVYAVKPSYLHVYTIRIHWMKAKEPYKPPDEVIEQEKRKKAKSKIEEILSADGLDNEIKAKLAALAYLEELGFKPKELGINVTELFTSKKNESDDPILKVIHEHLKKNPQLVEKIATKHIEKILKNVVGEEDEIDKMEKFYEFLLRVNPNLASGGMQSPFDILLMTLAPTLLPALPQLFGMGSDQLQGGQEEVVVKIGGKYVKMPKQVYDLIKRKVKMRKTKDVTKTSRTVTNIQQKSSSTTPTSTSNVDFNLLSQIETAMLNTKPEDMAKVIWNKVKSDKTIMMYVEQAIKIGDLDKIVELCKKLYPDPKVSAVIDALVQKHRDWFEKLLDSLKRLYEEERGEVGEVTEISESEVDLTDEDLKIEDLGGVEI